MEPEKLNVIFPEGQSKAELLIREVDKVVEKELPVLEPEKLHINANISAIYEFLEKRWNAEDNQCDHCRTNIIVDRDALCFRLRVNETDARNNAVIIGNINMSRQFLAFGLNKKDNWDPMELGNFFRINRTYFVSKDECMMLVNKLKQFKADIRTKVEREEKDNGSSTDVFRQVVDSSLPKSFKINIPIFKGTNPSEIEVEIIAHVHGRDFELELISADAAAIVEETRDNLFNEQIEKIRALAPEIPIIEA